MENGKRLFKFGVNIIALACAGIGVTVFYYGGIAWFLAFILPLSVLIGVFVCIVALNLED